MEIQQTTTISLRPNILTYGPAKSGKTHLLGTIKKRRLLIADTDGGLSTLRKTPQEFAPIRSWADWLEFVKMVESDAFRQAYQVIALDDIHRLGEYFLEKQRPSEKDGRKLYGALAEAMFVEIHRMRSWAEKLGYYVVTNSKEDRQVLDSGVLLTQPMFPGNAIQTMLDYLYDEVYHTEMAPDANRVQLYVLRTKKAVSTMAGSRFGHLREIEVADYDYIFDQMEAIG